MLQEQPELLARLDLLVQQALQALKEQEVLRVLQEQPAQLALLVLRALKEQEVLPARQELLVHKEKEVLLVQQELLAPLVL